MKKLSKKKYIIIGILILVVMGFFFNLGTNFNSDEKIDKYNFKQLEKVKKILNGLDENSYKFGNLKQFNEKYNVNIKPINNCYFIADKNRFFKEGNGGGGYIFSFELKSKKYIEQYGTEYYAYPKYDLPEDYTCFGLGGGVAGKCKDSIKMSFIETITNPCK